MVTELRELLKKFIERTPKIARPLKEHKATELWPQVVSAQISKNTHPLMIKNGILTVLTASSVWAQELRYTKKEIIKKLNEKIGEEVVRDIRFSGGGVYAEKEEN